LCGIVVPIMHHLGSSTVIGDTNHQNLGDVETIAL
jgi:hypothetical protein